MNTNMLVNRLCELTQLDIDAIHACEEAKKKVENDKILNNFVEICHVHMQHVDELSTAIKQLGGRPPEKTKDFKGYLMEGFTALRGVMGVEGALKAMKTNEGLIAKSYEKMLDEKDIPFSIRTVLQKNYKDEKDHLKYIDDVLASKLWKMG